MANMNTNTTTGMSAEMKTYYDKALIQLAAPELVHDQFGQMRDIPKNGGKTIQFRQFDPLPELTTPLTEGVTPDGQSLSAKTLEATVKQYGGYVTVSDQLELTAIDPVIVEATKAVSGQAGKTLDSVVRDILAAGTNVLYGGGVASRGALSYTSATSNCNMTVDLIRRAVRILESQDVPKIDGYYVAIVHPNVKYDLMGDDKWRKPHEYKDTTKLYRGEIGELYGVRFVENSRAKVFKSAGSGGADVYATLILGKDAYGVTEVEGGGLEIIVKPKGSGGTADPLDQRSTIGWKGMRTAEILVQQYMLRVETTASV